MDYTFLHVEIPIIEKKTLDESSDIAIFFCFK